MARNADNKSKKHATTISKSVDSLIELTTAATNSHNQDKRSTSIIENHTLYQSEHNSANYSKSDSLKLAEILDVEAIQSILDSFYKLIQIPMSIIDLDGVVIIGAGWQDICTNFHRIHPETKKHCIESDLVLSKGVKKGEFKLYKCKNNMWDMVTPIYIGDKHKGNLFSGQFFFDDEDIDYETLINQAIIYGFKTDEYLAAIERVPKMNRNQLNEGMLFFIKLADLISQLSYSNIQLAQTLKERNELANLLQKNSIEFENQTRLLSAVADNTQTLLAYLDRNFNFIWVNQAYIDNTTESREQLIGANHFELYPHEENLEIFKNVCETGESYKVKEKPFVYPDEPERGITYWDWTLTPIKDKNDTVQYLVLSLVDVTHDILAREKIKKLANELYEHEHNISQILQDTILPHELPSEIYGFNVAATYRPALDEAQIGGDFYDIFDLGDKRFGITIGDVIGKGLSAAVRVASARYAIRDYAYTDIKPSRVMELANNALCKDSGDESNMLTALFAIIDVELGTFTYSSAGHEPPIICNAGYCRSLNTGGIPLGIYPDTPYTQSNYRLNDGDRITLITDGINEAHEYGKAMYGNRRLENIIKKNLSSTPKELTEVIVQKVVKYAGGRLRDDAAIVVIDYKRDTK